LSADPNSQNAQRIDRWLWFARFLKTRSLATKFVEQGKTRLTSPNATEAIRITKASYLVRVGDVLTFPIGRRVRVIKVLGIAARRGPAPEAQQLYEDLAPPASNQSTPTRGNANKNADREENARRPNKRERRALLDLKNSPPTYSGNK